MANLVRTKTAKTLQSRFMPSNNETRPIRSELASSSESKSVPRVANNMVQEDQHKAETECRANDVRTAEATDPQTPLTSKTTLLRSETFELTSPDNDCTINLGQGVHSTIAMLKTSSPNSNTSPAKRKFGSFGESSHIFNSSEIPEPDKTLVTQNEVEGNRKDITETLSCDIKSPKGCNTYLKHITDSVISNISNVGDQSTLHGPGDGTVVFQSTMIQEQPKLIDVTSVVSKKFQPNPWNVTEVLPRNNVTRLLIANSEENLLESDQPIDLLMDVDEPEEVVFNGE